MGIVGVNGETAKERAQVLSKDVQWYFLPRELPEQCRTDGDLQVFIRERMNEVSTMVLFSQKSTAMGHHARQD